MGRGDSVPSTLALRRDGIVSFSWFLADASAVARLGSDRLERCRLRVAASA
jgi:hypothetical protein